MNSTVFSLLIILLFSASTFGQTTPQEFSLEAAVAHAIKNNEQVKQADLDVKISAAKVRETTAIGLPKIDGEASMNYYIDIPTQVAEANTFNPTAPPGILVPLQFGLPYSATAGISASQLIFDGSYFVGLKASKAYLNYAQLGKEKSEIDVKNSVSQTYFAVVSMQESLETLKENKLKIDQSAKETKALYEAGFAEQQDADQVRLTQSSMKYQIDVLERQKDHLTNLLKFQMGIPVEQNIKLTSDFDEMIEGLLTSTIDQPLNVERHIDFRTIKQGEELSELNLSAERTKSYPQLAAFFNHSQNGFSKELNDLWGNEFYPTTIAGLQLKVPIFSSGLRYYQTKQAKLELEKTQSQKDMLTQNLTVEALSAKADYSSALENLTLAEENLALAETIKKTTDAKYKEGLASSLDFAQAESQFLQNMSAYYNAAQELFNAKISLDKALGNY
ncbi:MAG: TolC family protein [Salibacteraceae bacterium]